MRIVLHDYSGHPFQVQLSRELAHRGHEVLHWHCSSYQTGKGRLARQARDPASFVVEGLPMGSPFARYSIAKRLLQEVRYGASLGRRAAASRADVIVLCNTPLIAHWVAAWECHRRGLPMTFWHQDIYSQAIGTEARARFGRAGGVLAHIAHSVERWIARNSEAIVGISESFLPVHRRWGVADKACVIPNWASLEELPLRPRDNSWARAHDLNDRPVVMYTGTLGLKHDPSFLTLLAQEMSQFDPRGRVVVVSEGLGRQWLDQQRQRSLQDTLVLLDYQPFDALPDVMASADVLVALLQPEASEYSVPSKVLTYLAAGRPIVGLMPHANAAAATIRNSGAGIVIDPTEHARAVTEIFDLLRDDDTRRAMGENARNFAESSFDIGRITSEFERVLDSASGSR